MRLKRTPEEEKDTLAAITKHVENCEHHPMHLWCEKIKEASDLLAAEQQAHAADNRRKDALLKKVLTLAFSADIAACENEIEKEIETAQKETGKSRKDRDRQA